MAALISFKIIDHPELEFRSFAVDGTEALSALHRFDIDCFGTIAQRTDALDLVGKRAALRFELEGAEPREVFGIIKSIISDAPSIYGDPRYRFELVPWLERLNYSRASQIYGTNQEISVVDVLEAEFAGTLRNATRIADPDFRIFKHELRLRNPDQYPKRDHLVQYEETDFAFISRLAEHYGIYYFFENDQSVEKVVFADENLFTKPIEGDAILDWKPWAAGSRVASPDTIQEMKEVSRMVPRHMWMLDYNYRLPHVPLTASAEIDQRGRGRWVEYGAHHRTPAEGETLARIRAEEFRSHQRRWTGKSAVARLCPGHSFKLQNHPYQDWNQEYLIISVRHEVRVPMPGVELLDDWAGYRNSFEVIQQKVAFRPARVTPVPRMDGLLNARIDGAGARDKAEIDEQGRYRVRVPFDNSDTPDGKGSQWVRMASPFGGDGDGMHFPLAPDTEVVVACVNGDPNRPVILGAAPNPRTKSVVTRENFLRNRMVTRTGMGLEMGADGGNAIAAGTGGGAAGNRMASQSAFGPTPQIGTPNALGITASAPSAAAPGQAITLEAPNALMASVDTDSANNYARLYASTSNYARLGAVPQEGEDKALTSPGPVGYGVSADPAVLPAARTDTPFDNQAGVFTAAAGQIYSTATANLGLKAGQEIIVQSGNNLGLSSDSEISLYSVKDMYLLSGGIFNLSSVGDINLTTEGKLNQDIRGDQSHTVEGDSTKTIFGTSTEWSMNASVTGFLGSAVSFNAAATVDISLAFSIAVQVGIGIEYNQSATLSLGNALDFEMVPAKASIFGVRIQQVAEAATVVQLHNKFKIVSNEINTLRNDLNVIKAKKNTTDVESNGTGAKQHGIMGRMKSLCFQMVGIKCMS